MPNVKDPGSIAQVMSIAESPCLALRVSRAICSKVGEVGGSQNSMDLLVILVGAYIQAVYRVPFCGRTFGWHGVYSFPGTDKKTMLWVFTDVL
jgi:hypothetical protein